MKAKNEDLFSIGNVPNIGWEIGPKMSQYFHCGVNLQKNKQAGASNWRKPAGTSKKGYINKKTTY